jgi:hypothetical protein
MHLLYLQVEDNYLLQSSEQDELTTYLLHKLMVETDRRRHPPPRRVLVYMV